MSWQQWYDGLTRREQIRYHIGIKESNFSDWSIDHLKISLHDSFWYIEEFVFIKLPCLLVTHIHEAIEHGSKFDICVYCGKDLSAK